MTGASAVLTIALTLVLGSIAHAYALRRGLPLRAGITLAAGAGACAVVLGLATLLGRSLSLSGAAIVACAAVCAATDLQVGYIFDYVLLAPAAIAAGAAFETKTFADALTGALACAAALLIPYGASRGRAMGFGDVKFAAVAGLALGLGSSLEALWAACVCGGGVAAFALATGRTKRGTRVPFGPFLAFGVCAALLFGTHP
jgi:leader peptidase (prepilin peptidase)/N-methyltransferase